MTGHDRRLHAVRPDLADARLQGRVDAPRFATGRPATVAAGVVDVRSRPDESSGLDTQWLRGDEVLVFDERDGFAWAQSQRDGYVGYLRADALSDTLPAATHALAVPRSFRYGEPDMKTPQRGVLTLGARVALVEEAETRGTRYGRIDGGEWVVMQHLRPVGEIAADFVAVAEQLLRTPYLWGGASALGLDCSGLVQLALRMAGRRVLRDADMQASSVGEPLEPGQALAGLRRGDLVFWRGHVGIMRDGDTLIHANGHSMDVALEPLAAAVSRIGYLYGEPTVFRRP